MTTSRYTRTAAEAVFTHGGDVYSGRINGGNTHVGRITRIRPNLWRVVRTANYGTEVRATFEVKGTKADAADVAAKGEILARKSGINVTKISGVEIH